MNTSREGQQKQHTPAMCRGVCPDASAWLTLHLAAMRSCAREQECDIQFPFKRERGRTSTQVRLLLMMA